MASGDRPDLDLPLRPAAERYASVDQDVPGVARPERVDRAPGAERDVPGRAGPRVPGGDVEAPGRAGRGLPQEEGRVTSGAGVGSACGEVHAPTCPARRGVARDELYDPAVAAGAAERRAHEHPSTNRAPEISAPKSHPEQLDL